MSVAVLTLNPREKQIAEHKATRRALQTEIREELVQDNNTISHRTNAHNRKCASADINQEREGRQKSIAAYIKSTQYVFKKLVQFLKKLKDPRRLESLTHPLISLMLLMILSFCFSIKSRKEFNREMTAPQVIESCKAIMPQIDAAPHADTIARVLNQLDPKDVQRVQYQLIRTLLSNKKFIRLYINRKVPLSLDGTQKLMRQGANWNGQWLERTLKGKTQQYVYVLEANITLHNGMTLPLASEFLTYSPDEGNKQDCETKALVRLLAKIKQQFPRQGFILFLDKLYAEYDVIKLIDQYHWDWIIALPSHRFNSMHEALKQTDKVLYSDSLWRGRTQRHTYINGVTHQYSNGKSYTANVVKCDESWKTVMPDTTHISTAHSNYHTWITNIPLTAGNIHPLCNLGARSRYGIEDSNNAEKHRGYHYEHSFSYQWKAMQNYHTLMRVAHLIKQVAEFSKHIRKLVKSMGVSAFWYSIKQSLFNPWVSLKWMQQQLSATPQIRLGLDPP